MEDEIYNNNNDVLLIGNGINRCFEQDSWENVIKDILHKSRCSVKYKDIEKLSAPMQVVVASNDNVNKYMKDFADKLSVSVNSEEQSKILEFILNLDIKNIITTNYSYEIEQAAGIKGSVYSYRKTRKFSKDGLSDKDKLFHLYQYNDLGEHKHIWHIHGDICKPTSIVMGHYYYGKLLSLIEKYCSSLIRRYKTNGESFKYNSWIDHFVLDNVYMVGFGLDFSESDIWWLLCYKKRHFPDTKVYYFVPKGELDSHPDKRLMLEAYEVVIKDNIKVINNNYLDYYRKVLRSVKRMIAAK